MPLPNLAQAASLGKFTPTRPGMCASCGKRPAAHGKLMCHECRAAVGITTQDRIFDIDSDGVTLTERMLGMDAHDSLEDERRDKEKWDLEQSEIYGPYFKEGER